MITAVVLAAGLVANGPPAVADGHEAPGAPATFRSISSYGSSVCAILDDGTVKCWGENGFGELGLGDISDRGDVPGEMGDNLLTVALGAGRTATAIAAGELHTCAVLDDATIKCWGTGSAGRLGYGNTTGRGNGFSGPDMGDNLPAVDLGTGRTAVAVAAGSLHTCAILDNHAVKCWGDNSFGQLGYGNTTTLGDGPAEMGDALPAVDLGTNRTAQAISAAARHTCALLDTGQVKCWGGGTSGRLGYGNTTTLGDGPGEMGDALPAVDLGLGRRATAISSSSVHTCALLDNAAVKCWGPNNAGELGQGDTTARGDGAGEMGDNLPPVALGAPVVAVSASFGASCALLDDATVKCWGFGSGGRLGSGDTTNRGDGPGEMASSLPTIDLGTGRTATAVATTAAGACAVLDNGELKCWGDGASGVLGSGDVLDRGDQPNEMGDNLPTVALGTNRTVTPVARVRATVTADQVQVVAGQQIDYDVTITNTGGLPLTQVRAIAPDVADCEQSVIDLAAGASTTYACSHTTTAADVPQMTNQVLVMTAQGAFALSGTRRTRVNEQTFRPDAQIRLAAGAFAGDGVYNTNGAGQARATTVANLGTATFTVRIVNDGNTIETFNVQGLGTTSRYTVTYKNGPTNITAAVVAGTFATDPLAPGASQDLTLTIKAKAGTPVGSALSRTVTITSQTAPTIKDAVKATVTRR